MNNQDYEKAKKASKEHRAADLRSADLRFADLRFANLRDANLRDADLRAADLRDADLNKTKISIGNFVFLITIDNKKWIFEEVKE